MNAAMFRIQETSSRTRRLTARIFTLKSYEDLANGMYFRRFFTFSCEFSFHGT